MATIVSTRILRLQAINPRVVAVAPPVVIPTQSIITYIVAPTAPSPGQTYYNSTDNSMQYWNGTSWVSLTGGSGGADILEMQVFS